MICPECGTQCVDSAKFCPSCGHPLSSGPESPFESGPDSTTARYATSAYASPTPATPAHVSALASNPGRGAFGRAWDDWKASPNKWLIAAKLAAADLIPFVGSLISDGYAYTWGKERALGKSDPMAKKIVRPGVMDTGLYVFLASIGTTVVSLLINLLIYELFSERSYYGIKSMTTFGSLLLLAVTVFFSPLFSIMLMRAGICGRVRSGFKLSEAWKIYTGNGRLGKFMAAYWLPGIIQVLIDVLLVAVFVFLVALFGGVAASGLGVSSRYYSQATAIMAVLSVLLGMLPLVVIFFFVLFFVGVMIKMITARAYGYLFEELDPASWDEYRENSGRYSEQAV